VEGLPIRLAAGSFQMPKKKSPNYEFVSKIVEKESFKDTPCEVFQADGAHAFRFAFGGTPGIIGLEFYAHGLRDYSFDESAAICNSFIEELRKNIGTDNKESDEAWPSDEIREIIAETIALVFLKGMSGKISSLLAELERETQCYVYEVARKFMPENAKPEIDTVEQLAREMIAERKRFLKGSIARFGEPRWNEMSAHYEKLLNDVSNAKDVYDKYKATNWRGMVEAGFPDLDKDIVTLLSDNDADLKTLPAELYEATADGEYRKLSDLALEQAARKCGMNPFRYVPRTLRGKMRSGGKMTAN
jgi:hypothetical protein